jgi:hypothetical protein
MAQKIIVEIEAKTEEAQRDLENLSKSFEDVYGDIKPLSTVVGELEDRLYQMAQAGDTTSDEFKNLTKEAGRLKTAQKSVDEIMDRSSRTLTEKVSTGLNTVASGAVLVSSTMQEFGVIGEDTAKQVNRGIAAISFVQFLTGLNETFGIFGKISKAVKSLTIFQKASTAAQWLWNAAMSANPLGAIVVAITAVIAAGYALISMFGDSTSASDKNTAAIKRQTAALEEQTGADNRRIEDIKRNLRQELELLKAKGATTEQIRKKEKEGAQLLINEAEKQRNENASNVLRATNKLNKLRESGSKEEIESQKEKLNKLRAIESSNIVQLNAYIRSQQDLQHRYNVEDITATRTTEEEKLRLIREANRIAKEIRDEANRDIVEVIPDTESEDIIELVDEGWGDDSEIVAAGEKAIKLEEFAKREIELEAQKTAAKRKALNDLVSIFGAESTMGRAALVSKQLMAAQELLIDLGAIKSKATKAIVGSQLNAVESGGAIATGFSKTMALGFPAAIPALIGYAASAVGIVSGVMAATKKTKSIAGSLGGGVSGGGSVSAPTLPSIPPSFNIVGQSSTNQLASAIGGQSQKPSRAYVVAGDVSTAQDMDRNIIEGSSL